MILNNIQVENISNADESYAKAFYDEINGLDSKLVKVINAHKTKIILANKLSDILPCEKNDIEQFQDYHPENRDELTHGLCSDTINAICIFLNTTEIPYIGAFLYHETGHLIDLFQDWGKENITECLSLRKEFVEAYKKDVTSHWEKIKKDNRFRLKHYIQCSTPDKISSAGLRETFAFCFAKNNNKQEDIDIISDYFQKTLSVAKNITDEFLKNI